MLSSATRCLKWLEIIFELKYFWEMREDWQRMQQLNLEIVNIEALTEISVLFLNRSNGFIVFTKSTRQTASKDDTNKLDQCNSNSNTAKQKRFVIQELK